MALDLLFPATLHMPARSRTRPQAPCATLGVSPSACET